MKRDIYKSKIYYTEHRILTEFNAYIKCYASLVEVNELFLKAILDNPWWKRRYPNIKTVFLYDGSRNGQYAWAEKNAIYLPSDFRNQLCILHELAHLICCHIYDNYGFQKGVYAIHGSEFVNIYRALIKKFIGTPVHKRFIEIIEEYKIIYKVERRAE